MQTSFVVPDTNTFLHYLSVEQVDWSELFPDQSLVLFICPPLIRELNKHKDTPRSSKLRDRAAAALRSIDLWADSASPVMLRNKVEVRFRISDASLDFASHNLIRDIVDDHFIAALLELQAESPEVPVTLLTRDTGLKLKARAHGFTVVALPDAALLPDDVFPSEKKLKELEAQIRELQNARPKLRLGFQDGSNTFKLRFELEDQIPKMDLSTRMAEVKGQYPKMAESTTKPDVAVTQDPVMRIFRIASNLSEIEPKLILSYNKELEGFFAKYETYLAKLADFEDWQRRTAELNLVLINDGSSPADDIEIFLHFPDGFDLLREIDYRKKSKAPEAPAKPKSVAEQLATGLSFGGLGELNPIYSSHPSPYRLPVVPVNVSGPKIRKTNSYEVNVTVHKAKHGIDEALDVMYLTFETLVEARSFSIDYTIHASNLPKHVSGSLNVIVP